MVLSMAQQSFEGLSQFADMCTEDFRDLDDNVANDDGAHWRIKRPDITNKFDRAISSGARCINEGEFVNAMMQALPLLLLAQVRAVWTGYCKGTDRNDMTLEDFCCCVVAGENSDHALAEYADISVESFQALGQASANAQGTEYVAELDAAKARLDAKLRAAKERVDAAEKAASAGWFGPSAEQTAEITEAKKALAVVEKVGTLEEASKRMQGMFRMWAARKLCSTKRGATAESRFQQAVLLAKGKHEADVHAFQDALTEQGGGAIGLQKSAFEKALQKVHPEIVSAQVNALWEGTMEGTDYQYIDVRIFCLLCQAISMGMARAAEFADMATEDFIALASPCRAHFAGNCDGKSLKSLPSP